MKTRKMRNLRKTIVAGFAAFMMLAESLTAFAAPVEHPEEGCTEEGCVCHGEVLYDEQFVDMDGNIHPVGPSGRVFCIKHDIVDGYYQTHVKNDDGGCTVKTYKGKTCIYCHTIWLGDLYSTAKFVKCPH